ncbi:hypothetical protein N7520_006264 [Penicillium odoratum]|uniref:uncharacterized protein n=1 Tax=Penicillium odoratum TaxID=1167516 RepID=UPI002547B241|nr:uncharacterized protein N7520_006264 [Penicillium odoratum]KAJ5759108.1 hypothetical protein N7520_006264 [Penicillium odoratum]
MDLHCRSPHPVKPRSRATRPASSLTEHRCWTCRSRKIKCDERQENGCGVCERIGLECAGYDVNLYWVTGKREDREIRRRSLVLYRTRSIYLPNNELDKILSTLDTIDAPYSTISMGPFSLFNAPSTDVSVGDADEYGELVKPTSVVSYKQFTPHFELSLPLFQDSEIALLLFHYKDHVAGLLQPVIHPENPWRTTYNTFALEGRLDLFLAHTQHHRRLRQLQYFMAFFHQLHFIFEISVVDQSGITVWAFNIGPRPWLP